MSDIIELADLGIKFHISSNEEKPIDAQSYTKLYANIIARLDSCGSHLSERDQFLGQTWFELPRDFKIKPTHIPLASESKHHKEQIKAKEISLNPPAKSADFKEIIDEHIYVAQNCQNIEQLIKAVLSIKLDLPEQNFAKHSLFYNGVEKPNILWIQDAPTEQDDKNGLIFSDASGLMMVNLFKQLGYDIADTHNLSKKIGFAHMTFWPTPARQTTDILDINYQACLPFILKLIELTKPSKIFLSGLESIRFLSEPLLQDNNFQLKPTTLKKYNHISSFIAPSRFLLQKSSVLKKKFWFDLLSVFYNND